MSNVQQSRTHPEWLEKMAQNRERISYGLFALAALLAVVPIYIFVKYRGGYLGVSISTLLLALVPAGAGLWNLLRLPGGERELDIARLLTLVVGGLCGLLLVLTSALLAYHWWDYFNGLRTIQGQESWRVWVAMIVLLGGLGLMFASLQVARSEERTSPMLRRLVYGYNAVLTGALLLAILGVVNVLAYVNLKKPYDWTSQSIYSLNSRSENILEHLSKPTKIYVILPTESDLYRRVQALLDNCQGVNPRIEVEYLSPDFNRDRVKRLAEQYKFGGRGGLLVIHGSAPNEDSQFIAAETLLTGSTSSFSQHSDNRYFKGEAELMSTISYLSQGKQQPVIYFAQGHDELRLDDNDVRNGPNVGLGVLKRRLETDHYTVKGWQFSPINQTAGAGAADTVIAKEVPKDAAAVVIAGGKRPWLLEELKALKEYLEPTDKNADAKGKLVVLFDEARDSSSQTGLEHVVGQYNVQVGNNRVLGYSSMPTSVAAMVNPTRGPLDKNSIAAAFEGIPFALINARTVQPKTPAGPEDQSYKAESLLYAIRPADRRAPIWVETDLRTPPEDWLREDRLPDVQAKVSRQPVSVAALVTQESPAVPPKTPAADKTPRMVVVGSVTPVCNVAIRNAELQYYDLFLSMLGWLRDRPADIGIEAKKPDVYTVRPDVNISRLLGLPIFMMVFGIAGLGTAVWIVRRR